MMPILLVALAATAQAPTAPSCAADGSVRYICGPRGSEDLARILGSPWIIASGLKGDRPAHLYRIDARTKRAGILFPVGRRPAVRPDPVLAKGCPGPPDVAAMSLDGVNILAGRGGHHRLYVANHGDRHAIELFDIAMRGPVPRATWIGCAPMPAGTLANAVVPLADGGMIVSSFHDPGDDRAWEKMARGENTGSLWEWHPGHGFRRIADGGVSGANGVALSADERTLYVSAWASGQLVILDRASGRRRAIRLGFLPDNIKRMADGTLLIGGQRAKVMDIAACKGPVCAQDWIIARVDPSRGTVTPLLTRHGNATLSYACGAVEVDGTLYITARADRRLAYAPLATLPSLEWKPPRGP